ncbi:MAG: HNH endonuclease [Actinomycetota bacterium]
MQVLEEAVDVMVPRFRDGIDALAADALAERLRLLRRLQSSVDAAITLVGRRADALAAAGRSGDAADVLRGDGSVRGRTARGEAQRARLVGRIPQFEHGLATGALGGAQLDSLVRHLDPLTDDGLAVVDTAELTRQAARLPADTFDTVVKRAVAAAAPDEPRRTAVERRAASQVRHWFDDATGMGHLHALLDPERYEAVTTALDRHTASLAAASDAPITKDAHLAAAALVDLVTGEGPRGTSRAHVTLVVDAATGRGETGHGHELCDEATARLRCDAVEQEVTVDDTGLPINVGRRYRTATSAQWTAIRAMYSGCAWEGCHRPLGWCQLHHLTPWSVGGRTDLANLVPLCSEHHHRVHEGRWSIELLPDRRLRIHRPDGSCHALTAPPRRFAATGPPGSGGTSPRSRPTNSRRQDNPGGVRWST